MSYCHLMVISIECEKVSEKVSEKGYEIKRGIRVEKGEGCGKVRNL